MLTTQDREILIKLKLIAAIKISERISTRYLYIQEDNFSTKISRYFYGENRFDTVLFCRNTITQSLGLLKTQNDPIIKKIIRDDLTSANSALQNLMETYSDSVRVVAEFEEIRQNIDRELKLVK